MRRMSRLRPATVRRLTLPRLERRRPVAPAAFAPNTQSRSAEMFAIDILKNAFHGPATARRRQPRSRTLLAVEILESREVFSLSPVSPYAGRPFTSIVELQATFPDHKTYFGSGVMVDRFHVLTAGHIIYSYADGGFASRVVATPDLYGNTALFGVAYMTYERTYPTFMNYNRTHPGRTAPGDYDIALITLDRTIGDRTGWMNYG